MIYSPIWKDNILETTSTTLNYRIRDLEAVRFIEASYTKAMPGQTGATLCINNKVDDRLKPDFGYNVNISGITSRVIPNTWAVKTYRVLDSSENDIGTYKFLYDWSYEDNWSGQTGHNMSIPVNGHIDPRMKEMLTIYNTAETSFNWVIVYDIQMEVSRKLITFSPTGGSETLEVKCNADWTITSMPSWLSADVTAGTGVYSAMTPTNVTFTTQSNPNDTKEGVIVFTHNEGSVTVPVIQYGTYIAVSPLTYTFPASGGSTSLAIESNLDWTITSVPEWLTVSQLSGTSGTTSVSLSVNENMDYRQKTATINVLCNGVTINVAITQEEAEIDMKNRYLTFMVKSGGTINFVLRIVSPWTGSSRTISYSINDGAWMSITSKTAGTSFNVSEGDVVRFKGNNSGYGSYEARNYYYINSFSGSTAEFDVCGNIMSLTNGDNFSGVTSLATSYTFVELFQHCKIKDASGLVLPATTLAKGCYGDMFYACHSLTTPPELPATTLAEGCYGGMFASCVSLTTPPELPATVMKKGCYNGMFLWCHSLTSAPELPSTELAEECYYRMFEDTIALTTPPELPATTLAPGCYNMMFRYSRITTPPELPATTLAPSCYTQMFESCYSLTTAPELPANTLEENCYNAMFSSCTSLNNVKCLATDISASGCTKNWLSGVSSSGTFVKASSMSGWTTGVDGIPNNWTITNA